MRAPIAIAMISMAACAIDFDRHFQGDVEVCTNGVDDDLDGAVDCADSDCGSPAAICVNEAPSGWTGPAVLVAGDTCPEGSTSKAHGEACAACSCSGSPTCTPGSVGLTQDDCTPPADDTVTAPLDGTCLTVDVSGGLNHALGSVPSAGGCTPSGGGATSLVSICEVPHGGGCADGICVAGGNAACVWSAGKKACPTPFDVRTLVTSDAGGSCSECACDAAACSAKTQLFASDGCMGAGTDVPQDGTSCVPADSPNSIKYVLTSPASGCVATGGEPAGEATTVCCLP